MMNATGCVCAALALFSIPITHYAVEPDNVA
jgi:hypothetical protein